MQKVDLKESLQFKSKIAEVEIQVETVKPYELILSSLGVAELELNSCAPAL